ncbi:MAG: SIMPL domain-containing protein [Patescibacteria group bacterium]
MQEFLNSSGGTKLTKTLVWLVAVGVIFMAAKTINEFRKGAYIGRDVASQNTITVTGEGEVLAKPDIATFTFSVTEEGKTVSEAQKKATDKTNKTMDFLKKRDVDDKKDTKTLSYNINPKYEYYYQPQIMAPCSVDYCPPRPVKEPKIIGYEVSQTIEVKVRKLEDAGNLLTGVGEIGVQNVGGLQFKIEDEDKVKREAQEKAIDVAKEKAEKLADQLGVSLVRITNFSEGGNYPIYYNKMMTVSADSYGRGGAAEPAPSVPSGENQILSNVTITYEIR